MLWLRFRMTSSGNSSPSKGRDSSSLDSRLIYYKNLRWVSTLKALRQLFERFSDSKLVNFEIKEQSKSLLWEMSNLSSFELVVKALGGMVWIRLWFRRRVYSLEKLGRDWREVI